MTPVLAAIDYTIFPPINASLNALSAVLLIIGLVLIKSGRREAHQPVMVSALITSAAFLACYLIYHYGVGQVEFPKSHPVARKIYLAILIPHIILAVVNLPFIILLVVAAFRGRFERHKRVARWTYPSWLFVSVTGVIIYLMLYHWYPPDASATVTAPEPAPLTEEKTDSADLVFEPLSQTVKADPGEERVEVTFVIKNPGAQPVRIVSLESGCECLEVSIDRNPVAAGGESNIHGIFDVSKLRGSSERRIIVLPEGRSRPVLLNTKIEIAPIYEIEPAMTNWTRGSEPATQTVTFRVLRDKPVHVTSAESKRPEVACRLVEVEKGRLYHLELTPASTEKTLLGIVRLETDCEIESYARPLAYYSVQ